MILPKKINIKVFLFLLFIVLAFNHSKAQDTLDNVKILVLGDATIVLPEATKLDYNPQVDPPKSNPPTLTYPLEDKEYKTKPSIVPARAQTYNSKESDKLYGNYTRLGYGNYNTPLFETYLNNTRSKNRDYGVHYKYLSSEYKPRNQLFADQNADAHFAYHISSLSKIKVNAAYQHNRINWYGFDPDSVKVGADSTRNKYNNFNAGVLFEKSGKEITDMAFNGGIDYYFQNDMFENTEHYFSVKGGVNKLVRKHVLTVPLNFTTTSYNHINNKYNRVFVDVNPRWLLDYGRLVLNVGFNSTLFYDTSGGTLYWYPFADFKIKIIENKLLAHMGIERGIQQNTFASIIRQNPFIDTLIGLKHTNIKSKINAGIWGSIGSKTAFSLEADFGNYMNMPFFVGDTSVLRKYQVMYDDVDIFNAKATVQLQWASNFKTTVEFGYHNYNPGNQKYYWNMPNMDGKLNLFYNYKDKFTAKFTAFYMGERFGRNMDYLDSAKLYRNSDATKLPAIIDLNLALEYRYNKMISVFLNGNNLTGQAYRRWLNYPVYRMGFIGGVTFTF